MRWALRRQFLIALGVGALFVLLLVFLWFTFFYHSPSCTDNVKNQNEEGIDCGGPCVKLCVAPTVSALWARSVEIAPGVYHAVALVQNPRTDAGTALLPYHFSLYDSNSILVAERSGTMYLNPGEVAPLFEAAIVTGNRIPARTFVSFDPAVWEKMDRSDMPVHVVSQSLDSETLKLTAHIENASAFPVPAFVISAFLFSADGNVVTASQTAVDGLAAHEERDLVFTWQEPFAVPIVKTDVVPRFVSQ